MVLYFRFQIAGKSAANKKRNCDFCVVFVEIGGCLCGIRLRRNQKTTEKFQLAEQATISRNKTTVISALAY